MGGNCLCKSPSEDKRAKCLLETRGKDIKPTVLIHKGLGKKYSYSIWVVVLRVFEYVEASIA